MIVENQVEYKYIFLVIIILIYIYYTLKFHSKIWNSPMLNKSQKRINIFMIWIMPFVWYYLIKGIIKPSRIMTKKDRKKRKGQFYESGIGIH